jgi:phosphoribosylglycinamide formyltransferase-1
MVQEESKMLKVFVLFSGGASGIKYLIENDVNYNSTYTIVGGFCDNYDAEGIKLFGASGIQVCINDIRKFYEDRGKELRDMDTREEYDSNTIEEISRFNPDVIVMSGYMWIITKELINSYRLINIHPGDLTVKNQEGKRRYAGYKPVYDAIVNGENETCSSVHFVTEDVDAGPIIVLSRRFNVQQELVKSMVESGEEYLLESYVEKHQERMKWEGDGPALAKALELIGIKEIDVKSGKIDRRNTKFYDLESNEFCNYK